MSSVEPGRHKRRSQRDRDETMAEVEVINQFTAAIRGSTICGKLSMRVFKSYGIACNIDSTLID
jgi:hypothetical protein